MDGESWLAHPVAGTKESETETHGFVCQAGDRHNV